MLSLESQENEMMRIAEHEGLEVVAVLKESRSAKEPNRPVFGEMLAMISKGKADAILCWKIDRLTRNPVDGGQIQWLLQSGRITSIRTFERTYQPSDNVLLMSIEQAMANQYIRDLSTNVKRGNRAKLDRGEWPHRPPLGYKNNVIEKTIVPDKKHVKTIQRVFEIYATGHYSFGEVATILHSEGYRSAGGGKIYISLIHRLLQNPFYHGVMVRQGANYVGTHKPLISKALWDKVQEVSERKLHPREQTLFFPLRGLLTCEQCQCMYTASLKKGHQYYYCTNGKGVCDQHRTYLTSNMADGLIADALNKVRFDEELIEITYQAAREQGADTFSYSDTVRTRLQARLEALDAKESAAFDSFSAGILSRPVYELKMQEIKNERITLSKELRDFKKQDPLATLEPTKEIFLQANRAKNEYLTASDEKKHKVASAILWNLSVENQIMAQTKYKPIYQLLANAPKNGDLVSVRAM